MSHQLRKLAAAAGLAMTLGLASAASNAQPARWIVATGFADSNFQTQNLRAGFLHNFVRRNRVAAGFVHLFAFAINHPAVGHDLFIR